MSLHLPERVDDLRQLAHDDHRQLYVADQQGDGYRLSRPALMRFEEFLETVAELEAESARELAATEARRERAVTKLSQLAAAGAVRDALVCANARTDLLAAAAALFAQTHPLRVEDPEADQPRVLLADPASSAEIGFAVAAWLDGPAGAPYRGRRSVPAGAGPFATALRLAFSREQ